MNFEWDKKTQKDFEEMQDKCRAFAEEVAKWREEVTTNREDMTTQDSAVSKFVHEVEQMSEAFRRMKHNCF